MLVQVAHITVLGFSLSLVRVMNQQIEAMRSRISLDDRLKPLFVQGDQFLNSLSELVQKLPRSLQIRFHCFLQRIPIAPKMRKSRYDTRR